MKVERKQRRAGRRTVILLIATEAAECSRCRQMIEVGDRVGREAGNAWSHRDCIRLGIVMPRSPRLQVSAGWGTECRACGSTIVQGDRWMRSDDGAIHASCR